MMQKVLVVDDDPEMRAILSMSIGKSMAVFVAANGEQALEIMRREHPQLVLLDYSMPMMNGIETLKAARLIDPAMRIVMLTGEKDVALAKKALEGGAVEYITKPFDIDYMRREIKWLLKGSRMATNAVAYRPWRIVQPLEKAEVL